MTDQEYDINLGKTVFNDNFEEIVVLFWKNPFQYPDSVFVSTFSHFVEEFCLFLEKNFF